MKKPKNSTLYYQEFLRREYGIRHHRYDEELRLFTAIKAGDARSIDLGMEMFFSELCGQLSDDQLRNYKYLFVCSATLATRFCIEGGMDEEFAYNASDYFIQKMDQCKNIEELKQRYHEMLCFYTNHMASIKTKPVYSKPIILCMDYIYHHLHEKLSVEILAGHVNLNPNYLSGLFKREAGQTVSAYITATRLETARRMLLYSDTSYSEIASILAFSSQSYFTKQFRKTYGCTPREYRKQYFQLGFERSWNGDPDDPYPSLRLDATAPTLSDERK